MALLKARSSLSSNLRPAHDTWSSAPHPASRQHRTAISWSPHFTGHWLCLPAGPLTLTVALSVSHCGCSPHAAPLTRLASISSPPSALLSLGDSSWASQGSPHPLSFPPHPRVENLSPCPPPHLSRPPPFLCPQTPSPATVSSAGPGSHHRRPDLDFLCWERLGGWAPKGTIGCPLPPGRGRRGAGPGSRPGLPLVPE